MKCSTQSGQIEVFEVVEEEDTNGVVVELCLLDVGLQVPCDVRKFATSQATVEIGMDPAEDPLLVLVKVGATFNAINGREKCEETMLLWREGGCDGVGTGVGDAESVGLR